MPLSTGVRLGSYTIEAMLGAGGMGEVYRARDTRLNRTVAVKVVPADFSNDPESRHRFEREARAIAALNHPHICTLYDVGSHDGIDFLVMEYLAGETLAARLVRGPLPAHEAIRYAIEIASALDRAHQAGIIHRDLKPGNIMLTEQGSKVLDFGLAKLTDGEVDVTRTADGTVVGTAAYMSPEQADAKPLDPRSDVFSFGAVLYEMLAGRRAFGGETIAQILAAVLRDEPPRLPVPAALDSLVRRCLAKESSQRFPSMAEVKAALEGAATAPDQETPSIAVLPFANMSSDPENEYFSDGLAEEIINTLTAVEGLRVVARASSFSFKGKRANISEIASQLNIRHVLDGSVRKAGNRVRVTLQLVDASNGYQLWSERYDRELADIFDVQDEIARSIVQRLKVALGGAGSRFVKVATSNMEAYQLYLKGRAMLYKRGPWIRPALESFQQALALDPDYAQAWAGVADAHTQACFGGYLRPRDTMPAALDAATRAVTGDPTSAEAHSALACVSLIWERDFPKAEREFREALRLNPQYIQGRCWYGLFFLHWGVLRSEEGLAELWRAFAIDPLSAYTSGVLSFGLSGVRRFDEAIAQGRSGVEQDPDSLVAQIAFGMAYHWNGQHDESIAVLEPIYTRTSHPWAVLGIVPSYIKVGRNKDALSVYEKFLDRQTREYVPPFILALCAATLGDLDAAFRHCGEAIEERDLQFAAWHAWWPEFEPLRSDPRFADIRRRFNAPRLA
ncbi:MAG: protein kinase [Acidobacteriota bacterium]|nr:protein kinase [Acidobacteriota bacterium]